MNEVRPVAIETPVFPDKSLPPRIEPPEYSPRRPHDAPQGLPLDIWHQEGYKWLGTPYVWGGEDMNGTDCSGFVQTMYRNVADVKLPRSCSEQFKYGRSVHPADLKPGDLVFFDTSEGGASHVGISLGDNEFIHASSSRGVIVSSLNDRYYASHFYGAKRIFN
ncbi:MAG: C40 family peptidase [Verrucomicrobia bacterium]|nr:C40 family peptidase [Verrucomicrobiota bacterium]